MSDETPLEIIQEALREYVGDGEGEDVRILNAVLADVWNAALDHAWKLNDPASSIIMLPDRPLLTEADIRQARFENPYK